MKRHNFAFLLLVVIATSLVLTATPARAQLELGVGAGGYFPINNSLAAGNAFAIEGSFSYRIASAPLLALFIDLPVVGTLHSSVRSASQLASLGTYDSLFIAPGLKLKLAPASPISPYIAGGIGWARFSKNPEVTTSVEEDTTTTDVFDIGGGIDMKLAPYVGIRAEARDFYSGSPKLTLSTLDERQHNVVATIGLYLRF